MIIDNKATIKKIAVGALLSIGMLATLVMLWILGVGCTHIAAMIRYIGLH